MLTGLRKGPRFLNRGTPWFPPVTPSLQGGLGQLFPEPPFAAGFRWFLARVASPRAEPGSGGN
jgi:hypothetical protein